MTGFRLAYGGAQEYYGVLPDLAVYGKALTCGFSLAAIAGRADVMATADPARKGSLDYAALSGTLSGNALACAAGVAALGRAPAPRRLPAAPRAGRAAAERHRAAGGRGSACRSRCSADGPIAQVFFVDPERGPVVPIARSARPMGARRRGSRSSACAAGIFTLPGTKLYLSLAHTDADIDWTLDAMEESLRTVA